MEGLFKDSSQLKISQYVYVGLAQLLLDEFHKPWESHHGLSLMTDSCSYSIYPSNVLMGFFHSTSEPSLPKELSLLAPT